jgi:membrane-associated protease RseP (regulator of RpoE activity)
MKTFVSAFLTVVLMSVSSVYAQQKAALGVTMSDNSSGGVLIASVIADSPAARIGLKSGDRILAINNQPTANYRDVSRIIDASQPNAPVELTVVRGAWQGKLTGVLGSADVVFKPVPQSPVLAYPAQQYVPASAPVYSSYPKGLGGFPRDWIDNGNRGVAASYGGGGW